MLANATDVTLTGVLAATPTLQTVVLTLSSVGSLGVGWLQSDIGKTIVVNQGSIVVAAITSATVATGTMVQAPTLAVAATSVTAASGSWA
eukprot:jgi/Hompol1/4302/HPOL_007033-RA